MSQGNNNGDNNAKQRKPGGITGKGFRPGQSGNPKGRPPSRGLKAALRVAVGQVLKDGRSVEQAIVDALVAQALRGRRKLPAITLIFDELEGKPRQQVDLKADIAKRNGRTDEELLHYAEHGKWPEEEPNG